MTRLWERLGIVAFWVCWPALLFWLGRSERSRVLIVSDKKILLVKSWLGSGVWCLPGGGIRSQESSEQAAIREVREETGLGLNLSSLHLVGHERSGHSGMHYMGDFFVTNFTGDQRPVVRPPEIIAVEWFEIQNLPHRLAAEVIRALNLAKLPS